jgi:hypothetical protein
MLAFAEHRSPGGVSMWSGSSSDSQLDSRHNAGNLPARRSRPPVDHFKTERPRLDSNQRPSD